MTAIFKKDFIYSFLEMKGRKGESKGEKYQCVVASHAPPPTRGPDLQPRHVP